MKWVWRSFYAATRTLSSRRTFVVLKILATVAVSRFSFLYTGSANGKVKSDKRYAGAVAMGVLWEVGKFLYIKALPWLDFQEVYGLFFFP